MEASIKAKSVLASFLHLAGVNSWKLRRYARGDIAVLMYHRVIPIKEVGRSVQAGMVVEPDTLNLHIRFLRDHFEIIPLSDLASFHHTSAQNPSRKPVCALTFDDGWCDFFEYAYPILKKHEAPATVFLPTDFIGTDRWFWTDRMGFLLDRMAQTRDAAKYASLIPDPLLGEVVLMPGTHEARLERLIAYMKSYKIEKIEWIISKLSAALGEDPAPADRAFLSWEEVQEMSGSGLVSFGSHTAGHPLLTSLTEEEAKDELRKSMDVLIAHNVADTNFISFSYPNGSFSERLSEMVREAGYHLAVTTQNGWHHHEANPYTIRRIAVHQDMASTEAMYESRIVNFI